jgi:membrane protease YdiL (CAAX protease family)
MQMLSLERTWSKTQTILVTTGICLSWFVIVVFSYAVARALFSHNQNHMLIFANILVIGLAWLVYLVFVPLAFGMRRRVFSFWKNIGFLRFDGKAIFILVCYVGFTILFGVISGELQQQFAHSKLPMIASMEPPLVEELMFRGIIMTLLLRVFSWWFSSFWSSLLFAVIHIELGWGYALMACIGALIVFSTLRIQSHNIWSGVFAHFAMIKGLVRSAFGGFVLLEVCLLIWYLTKKILAVTGLINRSADPN